MSASWSRKILLPVCWLLYENSCRGWVCVDFYTFTTSQCQQRHYVSSPRPFVRSSVRSSGHILLPRYLMNSLSNLDEPYREYSLAPTDDLIRFWRSKVKVTADCCDAKGFWDVEVYILLIVDWHLGFAATICSWLCLHFVIYNCKSIIYFILNQISIFMTQALLDVTAVKCIYDRHWKPFLVYRGVDVVWCRADCQVAVGQWCNAVQRCSSWAVSDDDWLGFPWTTVNTAARLGSDSPLSVTISSQHNRSAHEVLNSVNESAKQNRFRLYRSTLVILPPVNPPNSLIRQYCTERIRSHVKITR